MGQKWSDISRIDISTIQLRYQIFIKSEIKSRYDDICHWCKYTNCLPSLGIHQRCFSDFLQFWYVQLLDFNTNPIPVDTLLQVSTSLSIDRIMIEQANQDMIPYLLERACTDIAHKLPRGVTLLDVKLTTRDIVEQCRKDILITTKFTPMCFICKTLTTEKNLSSVAQYYFHQDCLHNYMKEIDYDTGCRISHP